MKKIIIVSICSLFLMACDKKTENTTDPISGLTGNCIDELKAYDELAAYLYDDKASPLYNKITSTEREQQRNTMINTIKTRSQEDCKHQANTLRVSIEQMKSEDSRY